MQPPALEPDDRQASATPPRRETVAVRHRPPSTPDRHPHASLVDRSTEKVAKSRAYSLHIKRRVHLDLNSATLRELVSQRADALVVHAAEAGPRERVASSRREQTRSR